MRFYTVISTLLAIASGIALAAPMAEPEPLLHSPVEKRAAGTITTVVSAIPNSGGYVGNIMVNGQPVNVLFDTGSTALWIKGQGNGTNFTYNYVGGGGISGNVAYGPVKVGDITIQNQSYGLVSNPGSQYSNYDGILGLGSAITVFPTNDRTFMTNALPLLKAPRLSVNMAPTGASTFAFGTDESSHQNGSVTWVPADFTSQSFVRVTASSFGVDHGNDTSAQCSVDTGTTDVFVPFSVAENYWSKVMGAQEDTSNNTPPNEKWLFPCSSHINNFTPTIGGTQFSTNGNYSRFVLQSNCGSRLQGRNFCILGQSFMYGWYTIFDFGTGMVGFAPRK